MNYQTYQQRPQHTPKKSSGGAKTCLILGLTGVALVALLMIIGVVGLVALGVSFRDAAEKRRADRMAELGIQPMPTPERVRPSRPAIRIEDIKDPKSITEAISMLNRSEYQYHVVAATWLAKQPVDAGQQARVSAALVEKTNRGTTQARNAAMDAFEKWAHPDSAGDFASIPPAR